MSFNDERSTIEKAFMAGWDSSATPVKFDNVAGLTQGNTNLKDETKLNEWCWLSIDTTDAQRADINAKFLVRYTGAILVNIFVKAGTGTDRARELAYNVATLLQEKQIDDVNTRAAMFVNIGARADSSFYQVSVRIPFYRDEFFTQQ